jgi:fatty-acyl-CoA synthase
MTERPLYKQGPTYGWLVAEVLSRHPERTAFVDERDVEITYAAAYDLFARLRTALAGAGVDYGRGVGMLAANSPTGLLTQWAGAANGARHTALHPLGSLDDHLFIAEDAELTALVVDPASHGERGRVLAERLTKTRILTLGPADYGEDLLAMAAEATPTHKRNDEVTEDDILTVIYTGGTTGRPKGVVMSHRAAIAFHYLQMTEWDLPRPPRYLAVSPLSHAGGLFPLPILWLGGTIVVRTRFTVDGFFDAIERHQVSTTFVVPSMLYKALESPRARTADISSLDMIFYGAAPMDVNQLIKGLKLWGQVFVHLYGQSEMNIVTRLPREEHDVSRRDRLLSCGRPAAAVTMRVLGEDNEELPVGAVGELCIRGSVLMDGYWHRPEETATALRDGWLHSGDLAKRDEDGFLTLVGRAKDMIVSGGFNVYPAEVEGALLTHPDVVEASVVGLPDPTWGEAVSAFVVRRDGATVTEADLIALVREKKGPVQAPKSVTFIHEIPLTAIGKPDKKALRAAYTAEAVGGRCFGFNE